MCECVWVSVGKGGCEEALSLSTPHRWTPYGDDLCRWEGELTGIQFCHFKDLRPCLPFFNHLSPHRVEDTPYPNSKIRKTQKANPVQRDQSCLLAQTPPSPGSHQPPSWLPLSILITCLFFIDLFFWERNCTHFVSNTCIFLLKEIKRRAGRKGKRIYPQNE